MVGRGAVTGAYKTPREISGLASLNNLDESVKGYSILARCLSRRMLGRQSVRVRPPQKSSTVVWSYTVKGGGEHGAVEMAAGQAQSRASAGRLCGVEGFS